MLSELLPRYPCNFVAICATLRNVNSPARDEHLTQPLLVRYLPCCFRMAKSAPGASRVKPDQLKVRLAASFAHPVLINSLQAQADLSLANSL